MRKSYSQYTADDLNELGIEIVNGNLFLEITPIPPSKLLVQILELNKQLPLQSDRS